MPSLLAFLARPAAGSAALIAMNMTNSDDEGAHRRSTMLPQICAHSCLTPPPQNRPFDAGPYWPVANSPTAHVPQMPAAAVDGDGADRVVDAEVLDEVDAEHDDDAGDQRR